MGGYHGLLIPGIIVVLVVISALLAFGRVAIEQHKDKEGSTLRKRSEWPIQFIMAFLPLIAILIIINYFTNKYFEIGLFDLGMVPLLVIITVLYAASLFIVHNICGSLGKSGCKLKDK